MDEKLLLPMLINGHHCVSFSIRINSDTKKKRLTKCLFFFFAHIAADSCWSINLSGCEDKCSDSVSQSLFRFYLVLLKEKSDDILYFSYCHQVSRKEQNQQRVDPISVACVAKT